MPPDRLAENEILVDNVDDKKSHHQRRQERLRAKQAQRGVIPEPVEPTQGDGLPNEPESISLPTPAAESDDFNFGNFWETFKQSPGLFVSGAASVIASGLKGAELLIDTAGYSGLPGQYVRNAEISRKITEGEHIVEAVKSLEEDGYATEDLQEWLNTLGPEPDSMLDQVVAGFGSFGAFLAVSAASGGIGGTIGAGGTFAVSAAAGLSASSLVGENIDAAVEGGHISDREAKSMIPLGLVAGSLEFTGMGNSVRILNRVFKGRQALMSAMIQNIYTEAGTEGVQTFLANVVSDSRLGLDGVVESMVVGGVVGGVAGGGGSIAARAYTKTAVEHAHKKADIQAEKRNAKSKEASVVGLGFNNPDDIALAQSVLDGFVIEGNVVPISVEEAIAAGPFVTASSELQESYGVDVSAELRSLFPDNPQKRAIVKKVLNESSVESLNQLLGMDLTGLGEVESYLKTLAQVAETGVTPQLQTVTENNKETGTDTPAGTETAVTEELQTPSLEEQLKETDTISGEKAILEVNDLIVYRGQPKTKKGELPTTILANNNTFGFNVSWWTSKKGVADVYARNDGIITESVFKPKNPWILPFDISVEELLTDRNWKDDFDQVKKRLDNLILEAKQKEDIVDKSKVEILELANLNAQIKAQKKYVADLYSQSKTKKFADRNNKIAKLKAVLENNPTVDALISQDLHGHIEEMVVFDQNALTKTKSYLVQDPQQQVELDYTSVENKINEKHEKKLKKVKAAYKGIRLKLLREVETLQKEIDAINDNNSEKTKQLKKQYIQTVHRDARVRRDFQASLLFGRILYRGESNIKGLDQDVENITRLGAGNNEFLNLDFNTAQWFSESRQTAEGYAALDRENDPPYALTKDGIITYILGTIARQVPAQQSAAMGPELATMLEFIDSGKIEDLINSTQIQDFVDTYTTYIKNEKTVTTIQEAVENLYNFDNISRIKEGYFVPRNPYIVAGKANTILHSNENTLADLNKRIETAFEEHNYVDLELIEQAEVLENLIKYKDNRDHSEAIDALIMFRRHPGNKNENNLTEPIWEMVTLRDPKDMVVDENTFHEKLKEKFDIDVVKASDLTDLRKAHETAVTDEEKLKEEFRTEKRKTEKELVEVKDNLVAETQIRHEAEEKTKTLNKKIKEANEEIKNLEKQLTEQEKALLPENKTGPTVTAGERLSTVTDRVSELQEELSKLFDKRTTEGENPILTSLENEILDELGPLAKEEEELKDIIRENGSDHPVAGGKKDVNEIIAESAGMEPMAERDSRANETYDEVRRLQVENAKLKKSLEGEENVPTVPSIVLAEIVTQGEFVGKLMKGLKFNGISIATLDQAVQQLKAIADGTLETDKSNEEIAIQGAAIATKIALAEKALHQVQDLNALNKKVERDLSVETAKERPNKQLVNDLKNQLEDNVTKSMSIRGLVTTQDAVATVKETLVKQITNVLDKIDITQGHVQQELTGFAERIGGAIEHVTSNFDQLDAYTVEAMETEVGNQVDILDNILENQQIELDATLANIGVDVALKKSEAESSADLEILQEAFMGAIDTGFYLARQDRHVNKNDNVLTLDEKFERDISFVKNLVKKGFTKQGYRNSSMYRRIASIFEEVPPQLGEPEVGTEWFTLYSRAEREGLTKPEYMWKLIDAALQKGQVYIDPEHQVALQGYYAGLISEMKKATAVISAKSATGKEKTAANVRYQELLWNLAATEEVIKMDASMSGRKLRLSQFGAYTNGGNIVPVKLVQAADIFENTGDKKKVERVKEIEEKYRKAKEKLDKAAAKADRDNTRERAKNAELALNQLSTLEGGKDLETAMSELTEHSDSVTGTAYSSIIGLTPRDLKNIANVVIALKKKYTNMTINQATDFLNNNKELLKIDGELDAKMVAQAVLQEQRGENTEAFNRVNQAENRLNAKTRKMIKEMNAIKSANDRNALKAGRRRRIVSRFLDLRSEMMELINDTNYSQKDKETLLAALADLPFDSLQGERITKKRFDALYVDMLRMNNTVEFLVNKNIRLKAEEKRKLQQSLVAGNVEEAEITLQGRVQTQEEIEAKQELNEVLEEVAKVDRDATISKMHSGRRWASVAMDIYDRAGGEVRNLMSSMDISSARQSLLIFLAHPKISIKSYGMGFKAAFGQKGMAERIYQLHREIAENEDFTKHGLYIAPASSTSLTDREEFMAGQWVTKFPPIAASNAHFSTSLNSQRLALAINWKIANPKAKTAEIEQMMRFINALSGRGNLPSVAGKDVSALINRVLFAGRFTYSRFEAPIGGAFKVVNPKTPMTTRIEAAKYMGALVAWYGGVGFLAGLSGFGYGWDPDDPNFGRIVIGKTRVDILGGYSAPVRFAFRAMKYAAKGSGIAPDLKGVPDNPDVMDLAVSFGNMRMNPAAGFLLELARGENVLGQRSDLFDVNPTNHVTNPALNRLKPLWMSDLADSWREYEDLVTVGAFTATNMIGLGSNTWDSDLMTPQTFQLFKRLDYQHRAISSPKGIKVSKNRQAEINVMFEDSFARYIRWNSVELNSLPESQGRELLGLLRSAASQGVEEYWYSGDFEFDTE